MYVSFHSCSFPRTVVAGHTPSDDVCQRQVLKYGLAVGAGLSDCAADRIVIVSFLTMMRKKKSYEVPCHDLVRRGTEPEAAACSALGVYKTAPGQKLKHFGRLSLGCSDALGDLLGLK
jgi:hypothetical protein